MEFRIGSEIIRVNCRTRDALFAAVTDRLQRGQGFALATLNLDHLVKMEERADFLAAYQRQDLIVADGNPIVWLSKLAKRPVELIPGSDLVLPMARLAAEQRVPVALFGSNAEVLKTAGTWLRHAAPGLKISAKIAPPMGFDPASPAAEALLGDVHRSGARLCFLALGAPKQELLAARGRDIAPQTGFISIGAGLDFLAGQQRRAPVWVRQLAMEWAWRMMSNPRRLALRYAQCALILPKHLWRSLRLRGNQPD